MNAVRTRILDRLKLKPNLQTLQSKILLFTFGASLVPVALLAGLVWQSVHYPLTTLERSRLDDQVLAFNGYTAATRKGLQSVTASYAVWTDLYNAVTQRDRQWIKREVIDQLVFSTANNIDTVQVLDRQGNNLGEANPVLQRPPVQQAIANLVQTNRPLQALVATGDGRLVILTGLPIVKSDGTGQSPGFLVVGQMVGQDWLKEFLAFSQPTTQITLFSLQGERIASSVTGWEPSEQRQSRQQDAPRTHSNAEPQTKSSTGALVTSQARDAAGHRTMLDTPQQQELQAAIATVQSDRTFYRIQPQTQFDVVYAPVGSHDNPVAMVQIQLQADELNQALIRLQQQIGLGLGVAILLSIGIARHLSHQIGRPIKQLAERSKTLAAGDLTAPIPGLEAGGELGQLAQAYADMATALQTLITNLEERVAERTQELERARQELEQRVSDRTAELHQKTVQLQEKNDALQEAHDQLYQLNLELADQTQQLHLALDDLKHTQGQLIQTEKMSSLSQMVAGIAHEVNNPISFIYGNLAYVQRYTNQLFELIARYQHTYPDPPEPLQELIEDIDLEFVMDDLPKILGSMKAGAQRIHQLVLSLRIFSRLDEFEFKEIDLNESLDTTLIFLQNRLRNGRQNLRIDVVKQYGNLPRVECYARQVNQVFLNVLLNAIEALEKSNADHPIDCIRRVNKITICTELSDTGLVVITIADNGIGMTEQVKEKLFDPFFTTKPVGQGMGLGLSTSYEIVVKKHSGRLTYKSRLGQGTEFRIELPLSQRRRSQMGQSCLPSRAAVHATATPLTK